MTGDFVKALVNACNSNMHYSDIINTNFAVKGKQIVLSVEGNFDLDKYIQDVNVEVVERSIAGKFFNMKFFPLSSNGVERVYNEDGTVREFRFNITPEVVHNLKLYFASSFQKSIGDEIQVKFIKAPDKLRGIIIEFLRCIKVGRMGGDINDLYSIELNDVESADAQMNKTLKDIYVEMFSTRLKKCGLKPSDFFQLVDSDLKPLNFLQLVDNRLYIKHVTDIGVVNNVTKYITECIAGSVIAVDNNSSKAKNIRDVIRSRIFKCTTTDEEEGVLIHGYDNDFFVDENKVVGENKVKDGSIVALIPLVKVNDQSKPEPLNTEEADRINKAFRKEGFGNILIDIRGQTERTQSTDSLEPVYGISDKQLALLVLELMKSPLVYNKASGYFEHAVNLGNFCKSREHSNLGNDLGRMLLPKFYKDGYLDKKGLSEASNYIWQCLSESEFGLDGYDMPELVEFVDKKIKELPSANRAIPQAINNTLQVPVDPMSASTHSNDSGCGTDSPSGSPKEQSKVMLLRPVALNSIAKNKGTDSQSEKIQLKAISSTGYADNMGFKGNISLPPNGQLKQMSEGNDNNMSTSRTEPLLSQVQSSQTMFVPRSVTLNIMAASRSASGPQQNSQSGQKTVQHVDKTCSAKPPASNSQQKSHDLLTTAGTSASAIHKHSEVLSTLDKTSVENSIDATSVQKTSAKSSYADKVQRKLKKEKSEKCSIL